MKTISQDYKTNVKTFGRQLDSKITYIVGSEEIELGPNELNSVTPSYESSILKSAMKQLDIDCNENIPVGTEVNYKFGVKVDKYIETTDETYQSGVDYYELDGGTYYLLVAGTDYAIGDTITGTIYNFEEYEYIDYGNYIVYESEKQEDTNSYKITCYDKMLYSMKPYEKLNITYPITIRNYLYALCNKIGLQFKNYNTTFANYDKQIDHELYLSYNETQHDYTDDMGYTFRDVLDELAQVTASTICIDKNDKVEIRYITDTDDTINADYLKDVNVNFGEKYGPINSVVLSRAGNSDKIYKRDEQSVTQNGLCEINISENQIMNFNDRVQYLDDLLDTLDGLEYYINDFSSTGITYYEMCDRYNIQIDNNTYSCVMFNDEVLVSQGLEENIHTDMPEQSKTDYEKADKTDRKINQTYIIVDKQNQIIESVVTNVTEQNEKISQITQTVDQIESQIQDVPTITTENSGTGSLYLANLMNMKLISLRIHPTDRDILGLFASPLLKVRSGLKTLSRGITFDGDEDVYYKLPDNLYFYDNETYDEFFYDGKEEQIYVIRKVAVDAQGNKSILDTPIREDYPYEDIIVPEGNYNVFMDTYPTAFIYVKAMIKNDYTSFFATSYEVDSKITQTADEINLEVSNKVDNEDYNGATIMLKINADESQAKINADKVDIEADDVLNLLAGNTINLTSKNITIDSTNFSVDQNGNMTANNVALNSGTFKGSIDTGNDCKVGNNLYVGQNQSSSGVDFKYIKFSDDCYINRFRIGGKNNLLILTDGQIQLSSGSNKLSVTNQGMFFNYNYNNVISIYDAGLSVDGDLNVFGSKNRVVSINDNKKVRLNAYETATPYFGDIGSNKTNKSGECKIEIENIFSQTIENDDYKVFIQECGEGKLYVEKHKDYFIVKGTPNLDFDWEIKAIQKGYKDSRLEEYKNEALEKESDE